MDNNFTEKTLSSEVVYEGYMLKFRVDQVELPNGIKSTRDIVMHPGGVVILPVTTKGEIVLVEQYRYPIGQNLLEVPAGKLDSKTEDIEAAAHRELREETGYQTNNLTFLGEIYPAPGYCDESLHFYLAEGLKDQGELDTDHDEMISTTHLSESEFKDMVRDGRINDAKTITAYTLWRLSHTLSPERA